jgi:hypothetical protein
MLKGNDLMNGEWFAEDFAQEMEQFLNSDGSIAELNRDVLYMMDEFLEAEPEGLLNQQRLKRYYKLLLFLQSVQIRMAHVQAANT